MELTLEELETVKKCLDYRLSQTGNTYPLSQKIIKILDKIEIEMEE